MKSICLNTLCNKNYIKKRSDQNFCSSKCYKINYYSNNKDFVKERNKFFYNKFKEKRLIEAKEYYKKNKEKNLIYKNQYYKKNAERIKLYTRNWRKANKKITNSYKAKRKLMQKNAIPKWANLKKIKEIYKNCPDGYHVDHIIPINSKVVCGLHVENNLQYLTPIENIKKRNKLILNF